MNLLIAKWNEYPNLPKAILTEYEIKQAAIRFGEKEFVDKLDEIVSKCNEIRKVDPKKTWINLGWILKEKANYQKVLSGEYYEDQPKQTGGDRIISNEEHKLTLLRIGLITREQFKLQTGKEAPDGTV